MGVLFRSPQRPFSRKKNSINKGGDFNVPYSVRKFSSKEQTGVQVGDDSENKWPRGDMAILDISAENGYSFMLGARDDRSWNETTPRAMIATMEENLRCNSPSGSPVSFSGRAESSTMAQISGLEVWFPYHATNDAALAYQL